MTDPSVGTKKKKVTITASLEGVEIAEKALIRMGFESKSNFAKSQLLARSTVTKFFQYEPIQLDSFKRICEALELNWREIAGLTEEKQPKQLSTSSDSSPGSDGVVEQVELERRQVTVIGQQSKKIKAVITLENDIDSVQSWNIIQYVLREYSGDTIEITDIKEGSIRLFVEGSPEDIERLVSLINSGELKEVRGFPVEDVQILSESSDDESVESDEKWRLVREIVDRPVEMRQLSNADLSDANLRGANLRGANLRGADLRGADLSGANLSGANLSAPYRSGAYAYLGDANLSAPYRSGADLSDADLSGADLSGANLSGANLSGADLSGANLNDANLNDANLSGTNLSYVYLSLADLSGTNLSNANLSNAYLSLADLIRADLRSADLSNADLSNANLSDANLSDANLSDANLSDANLRSANLRSANLRSANMRSANLRSADLRDASLSDANLSGAYLSDANLSNANLETAIVVNALFRGSIGLTEDIKLDLERRGAIFGDRPPVLNPR